MRTGRRFRDTGLVTALGVLLAAPGLAEGVEREAVAATPYFALHSDFATNLNDSLIAAGGARNRGRPELFHAGPEEACFDELPAAERAAGNRAVDYYAEIVSPADFLARERILLREELAGTGEGLNDSGARRFVEIARSFGAAATAAYEACRWAAQDEENRRWIEELTPRLTAHEDAIGRRSQRLYEKAWHGLPIPVDVVSTNSPYGASTIAPPPSGGHILISSSNEGYQGHRRAGDDLSRGGPHSDGYVPRSTEAGSQ